MAKYVKTFDAPTSSQRRVANCLLVPTDAATLMDTATAQSVTGVKTFAAGALAAQWNVQNLAGAGTNAATAGVITAASPGFVLATGGNNSVGVILPVAAAGMTIRIKNDDAANGIMKVYPQVNSSINGTANSALSMAANTCAEFVALNATAWFTNKVPA